MFLTTKRNSDNTKIHQCKQKKEKSIYLEEAIVNACESTLPGFLIYLVKMELYCTGSSVNFFYLMCSWTSFYVIKYMYLFILEYGKLHKFAYYPHTGAILTFSVLFQF